MVEPYDPACVNPASIDLTLSDEFGLLLDDGQVEFFTSDHIYVEPGQAILASSIEYIRMPEIAAGTVYLKSSRAREGLDHALAGWVDPGFEGTLTLEIHSHRSLRLAAGQRVIQLVLSQMLEQPEQLYQGRYQGQTGPTMAR